MIKSAVMVFSKDAVNFLAMEPGICIIIKKLLDKCRKKVNQPQKVISNRNVNLSAHRLLLLSVIRPI